MNPEDGLRAGHLQRFAVNGCRWSQAALGLQYRDLTNYDVTR
jgi:hypothetical protein